jgi:RecJ-like exonuclease
LYDADNCDGSGKLYEPMEEIPCPLCQPKGAVEYWTERMSHSGKTKKEASAMAKALVADIRKNRGVMDSKPALVFTHCNVCGIKLRTEDEDKMGMCERCAAETAD